VRRARGPGTASGPGGVEAVEGGPQEPVAALDEQVPGEVGTALAGDGGREPAHVGGVLRAATTSQWATLAAGRPAASSQP